MLTSSACFYVIIFFTMKIMYGEALCSCDQPNPNFGMNVNLTYYKCNNNGIHETIDFPITAPQGLLNVLESDKRTIIYIFGYLENPQEANVKIMIKGLCSGNTDNVVLLDWSKYSVGIYPGTFQNAEKVGSLFAKSIKLLNTTGFDVSKLHIIGHSLGSHIAGFAGKCNKFDIPRITALDPANPIFYIFGCYLTPKDATWIDVIHTDMGGYGTFTKMGTAEYYANGGVRPQPGCSVFAVPGTTKELCSHQKSVELFVESKLCNNFTAVECSSYISFTKGRCDKNLYIGVGYMASNVTGSFYFNTINTKVCTKPKK